MFERALKVAKLALAFAGVLLCASLTWMAWQVFPDVRAAAAAAKLDAQDAGAESRDITIAVLRPCQPGKPATCGLVPALRQVVQDMGAAVDGINAQVAQSARLIDASSKGMATVANSVKATSDATNEQIGKIGGLADAFKADADAAKPVLTNLAATLAPCAPGGTCGPLAANLEQTRLAVATFNGLLASKDLTAAMHGGSEVATNFGKISGDLYAYEHPILNPDPCRTKVCKVKATISKVSALFPPLEAAYDLQRLWVGPNQNVRVNATVAQPGVVRSQIQK